MTTNLRILPAVIGLLACSSGPDSSATLEIRELDGQAQTSTAVGRVAWSGGGEQIGAQLPGGDPLADDALVLPLRITRVGPYTAQSPVTVRAFGRSWVSDIEAPPEILIDRMWFTGDPDFPWRHFGAVELEEPRPVDHSLEVLSVRAEFSIAGPNCQLANPGESRCGLDWPFPASADLVVSEIENDCPDYVVETWLEGSAASVGPFQIDMGGFKRIPCQDLGDGRRLCGSHEDDMEVGSCLWNASIALHRPDELRIEGVARCGESGALQTCTTRLGLAE